MCVHTSHGGVCEGCVKVPRKTISVNMVVTCDTVQFPPLSIPESFAFQSNKTFFCKTTPRNSKINSEDNL